MFSHYYHHYYYPASVVNKLYYIALEAAAFRLFRSWTVAPEMQI